MSPEVSQSYSSGLPETAVCPGCNSIVVLPVTVSDGPLPICSTCGSEVPDHRREAVAEAAAAQAEPADDEPESLPEEKRYTRSNLLSALRDTVAEKGIAAINKRTPPSFRQ
jgi:hypothetical protein